jgi:hypothetical protein
MDSPAHDRAEWPGGPSRPGGNPPTPPAAALHRRGAGCDRPERPTLHLPYTYPAPTLHLPYTYPTPALHLPYAGLPYAGLPYAGLPYAGLPYAGLPYAGLPYTSQAAYRLYRYAMDPGKGGYK